MFEGIHREEEGRGEDRKARIGNKVRKHIGNRGLISSSPRIMDDLFIDRHKSELRAGIYRCSLYRVVVEKQSDKVGGRGGVKEGSSSKTPFSTGREDIIIIGGNGMIVKGRYLVAILV